MEVVLAIALTSVVVYLLTSAIQLYMVRVDSSRSRVESAQLARTILDRIAADLTATRLEAPAVSAGAGGGSGGGSNGGTSGGGNSGQQGGGGNSGQSGGQNSSLLGNSGGGSGQQNSGANGGGSGGGVAGGGGISGGAAASTPIQGLFGTVNTLRIDRSAYGDWQRAARPVDPQEPASAADLPATVRYFFEQGARQSAEQLAAKGVSDEKRQANVSGLYRQVIPTASLAAQTDPLAAPSDTVSATPELMAPEIVKLEIAYYDGQKALQEWDTSTNQGLPSGVEIILTVYEPRDDEANPREIHSSDQTYQENELVEYRRFVRLPYVSPAQPAEALLPAPGSNNNQQASGQQGQGGGGGNRGGGQSGQGNSGGGQNSGQGGSNGR
jgi:uncharacterized membrane protein YgcG